MTFTSLRKIISRLVLLSSCMHPAWRYVVNKPINVQYLPWSIFGIYSYCIFGVNTNLAKVNGLCDWAFKTKVIIVCDSFFGQLISIIHCLLLPLTKLVTIRPRLHGTGFAWSRHRVRVVCDHIYSHHFFYDYLLLNSVRATLVVELFSLIL